MLVLVQGTLVVNWHWSLVPATVPGTPRVRVGLLDLVTLLWSAHCPLSAAALMCDVYHNQRGFFLST